MSDATWIPVFVTAPVPEQVIKMVLKHGQDQCLEHETFINTWVLIQQPDQSTFATPTNPPVRHFKNEFVGASIEDLKIHVAATFGLEGAGPSTSGQWIAHDASAVIDARTAQDSSIAFYLKEKTDPLEQAKIRVLWNKGTLLDRIFFRLYEGEDVSEQQQHYLFQNLRDEAGERVVDFSYKDIKSASEQMDQWVSKTQTEAKPVWMEVRMRSVSAIMNTYGIWEAGMFAVLTTLGDDRFDEHGVLL